MKIEDNNGVLTVKAPINRVRRITGYLTGSLDRWNDAKKSEERDRVKHNIKIIKLRSV